MANALHRPTLRYVESVDMTELPGNPADWIRNPDMSAVRGVPPQHWKLNGDVPVPMTNDEIAGLIEAEASQMLAYGKDAAKAAVTATTPTERANRAAQRVVFRSVKGVIQSFNALRLHILDPQANPMPAAIPVRTWQQLLSAVRMDIDAETDPEG